MKFSFSMGEISEISLSTRTLSFTTPSAKDLDEVVFPDSVFYGDFASFSITVK